MPAYLYTCSMITSVEPSNAENQTLASESTREQKVEDYSAESLVVLMFINEIIHKSYTAVNGNDMRILSMRESGVNKPNFVPR